MHVLVSSDFQSLAILSPRRKQPPPATHDFLTRPARRNPIIQQQDDVQMVVEHRKASHIDGENPGQFFQRLSLPPSPTSSSLIAQRGSVASTASGAHNRPRTKMPAAHTVKCSGSTASPSNPPKTAVASSSQDPPEIQLEEPIDVTCSRSKPKL